jgi:hypothetical protein
VAAGLACGNLGHLRLRWLLIANSNMCNWPRPAHAAEGCLHCAFSHLIDAYWCIPGHAADKAQFTCSSDCIQILAVCLYLAVIFCRLLQATLLMKDAHDRAKLRHPAETQAAWIKRAQGKVFDMLHQDAFQVTDAVLVPLRDASYVYCRICRGKLLYSELLSRVQLTTADTLQIIELVLMLVLPVALAQQF